MALDALGSITVANDGTVTKSGECSRVYDLLYADAQAAATEGGYSLPTDQTSVGFKKNLARMATTIATYVHDALTSRAKVQILTSDSGLQRMSNPVAVDSPTQGPAMTKLLSIV